jgi:XTP/dITP diphosphohydrolase
VTVTLVVGTTNPGKMAEVAALLAPLSIPLRHVALEMPETKDDFHGNAAEKALAYAAHAGGVALSEDSGLVIPALDGLPGPWSAYFVDLDLKTRKVTPSGRTREVLDPLNSARVLELMKGIEQPRRAAVFHVALVVARPGEVIFTARAERHGWIADEARGARGFGYDAIFVGQDTYGKTYAELDPVRKNLRSHRKKVLDELFLWASQHRDVLA